MALDCLWVYKSENGFGVLQTYLQQWWVVKNPIQKLVQNGTGSCVVLSSYNSSNCWLKTFDLIRYNTLASTLLILFYLRILLASPCFYLHGQSQRLLGLAVWWQVTTDADSGCIIMYFVYSDFKPVKTFSLFNDWMMILQVLYVRHQSFLQSSLPSHMAQVVLLISLWSNYHQHPHHHVYKSSMSPSPLKFDKWSCFLPVPSPDNHHYNPADQLHKISNITRYTFFIIAYPAGVTGELLCSYSAMIYSETPFG